MQGVILKEPYVIKKEDLREGLHPLYKAVGDCLLLYVAGGSPRKYKALKKMTEESVKVFRNEADIVLQSYGCLHLKELEKIRVLKPKHSVYASYLAVISSYPILSKVCSWHQMMAAVQAKIYLICSTKGLDNLNDEYHTKERALESLERMKKAFLLPHFSLQKADDWLSKIENSLYVMARQTYQILSTSSKSDEMFEVYKSCLASYFDGQIASLRQKSSDKLPTLNEFLREVSKKGVGKVWCSVDFCFFEGALRKLDAELKAHILEIAKAADYVHRGCNIYDDVADLHIDLSYGISNAVTFLAREFQRAATPLDITHKDVWNTIELGNIHHIKGIKTLRRLKLLENYVDLNMLIRAMDLTRLFAIRKWFLKSKDILRFIRFLRTTVGPEVAHYSRQV